MLDAVDTVLGTNIYQLPQAGTQATTYQPNSQLNTKIPKYQPLESTNTSLKFTKILNINNGLNTGLRGLLGREVDGEAGEAGAGQEPDINTQTI